MLNSDQPYLSSISSIRVFGEDRPDPYERVREIAKRLGVEPITDDNHAVTVFIGLRDGTKYDVFDLVDAFLDKVGAVLNEIDAILDKEDAALDK